MQIILSNTLAINILVFIILPILILYKFQIYSVGKFNVEFLSKSNTNIIKGVSVILVILCHISMFTKNDSIMPKMFINTGLLAVAIFFFASGYGLMSQFQRKENYLKGFILNKIIRLYLIFFISNIIVTIINNIFLGTGYGIKHIIISSLYGNFANGRELWFVVAILFFYLSFYVAFKFLKDKGSIISICIAPIIYIILCKFLGKGTWWYNTAFCFVVGVLVSIYKDNVFNFLKEKYVLNLAISLISFVITMFFYTRGYNKLQFIIPIIFIYLVCVLLMKVGLKSKSMSFINKISLEMYLVHLVILQVAFKDGIARDSIYLVVLFPVMILLSVITKLICDNTFKILFKNKEIKRLQTMVER